MKEKFYRFMQGRYGVDQLSKFMLWIAAAFTLLSLIIRVNWLYTVGLLILILVYFRIFSRNIPKRYQENQKYLELTKSIRVWFKKIGFIHSFTDAFTGPKDTTHRIFRCPKCHQKIRVPKGRGKIAIHCPHCQNEFIKKS
jgi:hypothetical protein